MTDAIEVLPSDKQEIVRNLVRLGVDPRTVASAAKISVGQVTTISNTVTSLTPEDAELADAMRTLGWIAYEEAMQTLMYGSPADRQSLVRTIIGRTMGLVGMTRETHSDDMRAEFSKLMENTRGSEEVILPTDDFNAAQISPPTE